MQSSILIFCRFSKKNICFILKEIKSETKFLSFVSIFRLSKQTSSDVRFETDVIVISVRTLSWRLSSLLLLLLFSAKPFCFEGFDR